MLCGSFSHALHLEKIWNWIDHFNFMKKWSTLEKLHVQSFTSIVALQKTWLARRVNSLEWEYNRLCQIWLLWLNAVLKISKYVSYLFHWILFCSTPIFLSLCYGSLHTESTMCSWWHSYLPWSWFWLLVSSIFSFVVNSLMLNGFFKWPWIFLDSAYMGFQHFSTMGFIQHFSMRPFF